MKLTTLLLITVCLHVSASSFAQKVTISGKDLSLEKVFSMIKKQTGYVFFYDYSVFQGAKNVSLNVKGETLENVLDQVLKEQDLEFKILDKTITITKKPVVSSANQISDPQEGALIDIHGRIVDEKGQPLNGSTIRQKKGRVVAITNEKGEFEIRNVPSDIALEISYTGYESQTIKAGSRSFLNIVLKLSQSKLDEVHVVAYGTSTQRYNVGSVSKVTSEEIASQPVTNPLQALAGRVAGLVVDQTSGTPGSSIKVQIRGQNSLKPTGGYSLAPLDQPLFIIDGVPFAPQNANINQLQSLASPNSSSNPYGGISPFSLINPSDIENIEVLRDADATTIYGSRGSNGVILITTKKGKAGKASFSVNAWTGESHVTRTMPMMNTQQYLQMRHQAIKNDGLADYVIPQYAEFFPDILIYDTTKNTDWKKYFLGGSAHTTNANASVTGGNANTQFLIGSGYSHQTYIFPGNFSDNKITFNANIHHSSIDRKFILDFSAGYGYDDNNSSGSPSSLLAFTLPPDYPELVNADGSVNWVYKGFDLGTNTYGNPLSYLKKKYRFQGNNLNSHFQIGYQLLPGLILRSSFGYNSLNSQENSQSPKSIQDPAHNPSANSFFGTNNFQTWIIEPQTELSRSIGAGKLNVLVGSSFQQNINRSTNISGYGYTNDALLGSLSAAGSTTALDGYSLYKYSGAFTRINYIYSGKYILNLSARRDGSSRFGRGRQFGDFGSVAAGWIFSEEEFVKNSIPFLSFGKLHASYGTTGGDGVGDYQYIANWGLTSTNGGYSYQGNPGYAPSNLSNPDFRWTVNKKLEIGMDLGILKDRILVTTTWFQNRCGNQLVSYNLPGQTGFGYVTQNFPAQVENKGLELQVSSTNIKTKSFSWTSSLNLTFSQNRLRAFPNIESSSYANIYKVGQSLSLKQGYRYLGVNDTTGLFQFSSKIGPTISPTIFTDFIDMGNTDPSYYGGIRNTFAYKGFQLDMFLEFRKQKGFNYFATVYASAVGGIGNQPAALLQSWEKPGDHKELQQFTSGNNSDIVNAGANFALSNGAFSDASYIRFKTLSISYALNNVFVRRIKMDAARIYVNAQNLFTITKYKGNDPETQDFYGIPPLKTITAGLQFNF